MAFLSRTRPQPRCSATDASTSPPFLGHLCLRTLCSPHHTLPRSQIAHKAFVSEQAVRSKVPRALYLALSPRRARTQTHPAAVFFSTPPLARPLARSPTRPPPWKATRSTLLPTTRELRRCAARARARGRRTRGGAQGGGGGENVRAANRKSVARKKKHPQKTLSPALLTRPLPSKHAPTTSKACQ